MEDDDVVVDLEIHGQIRDGVLTVALTVPGVRINIESLWDRPSVGLLQGLVSDLENVLNEFFESAEIDEGERMVSEDEYLFGEDPVPRDRFGRPMIIPVGGGKPIAYTRCSTFAKSVSESTGLNKWKQRQIVSGLLADPRILHMAPPEPHGRPGEYDRHDAIIEAAYEAAGANDSARKGTAIHGLTEWADSGVEFDRTAPGFAEYMPFVEAYEGLTRHIEMLAMERFVVNDELQVAGTFDRLCRLPPHYKCGPVIGDLKTGKSAGNNPHEAAIQTAVYARSEYYDPETGERTPISTADGEPVDTSQTLLIHVPSNGAQPVMLLLDAVAAWQAALLAQSVRRWRKTNIAREYTPF